MILDTKLGTYQQVFGKAAPLVQEFAKVIADFILDFDKDAYVVIRAGEKSVTYGVGPKKMSEAYCYIMPQKDYLNLGFYQGSELSDPEQLLEGSGKKLRHVKITTLKMAKSKIIKDMIIESYNGRVAYKNKK
jgi:Domain of unknown function (DU1801)